VAQQFAKPTAETDLPEVPPGNTEHSLAAGVAGDDLVEPSLAEKMRKALQRVAEASLPLAQANRKQSI
jgi:hypothetical protein